METGRRNGEKKEGCGQEGEEEKRKPEEKKEEKKTKVNVDPVKEEERRNKEKEIKLNWAQAQLIKPNSFGLF
jgi:hypothetical protein